MTVVAGESITLSRTWKLLRCWYGERIYQPCSAEKPRRRWRRCGGSCTNLSKDWDSVILVTHRCISMILMITVRPSAG